MEASQVAKLAKNYLARAGVPDKYTAQSIRAAASSAAVDDGTSMSKVLAQGRWSTRTKGEVKGVKHARKVTSVMHPQLEFGSYSVVGIIIN